MALKLICVSQFISDLKGTNYTPEDDFHLFSLAKQANETGNSQAMSSNSMAYDHLHQVRRTMSILWLERLCMVP